MTTPCPTCNSPLSLTRSGTRGLCFHCSHQAGEFVYHEMAEGRTLGRAARDEGAATVLQNAGDAWRDRVAFLIDDLARSRPDLTADDVRAAALRTGLGDPHHHNAWGAALLAASRRGSIRRTMTLRASTRKEANAHSNPVWSSLLYRETAPIYTQQEVW